MQRRRGKEIEVADVVVMQMGDHDIGDFFCLRPQHSQPLCRTPDVLAAALRRHRRGKAGVDHDLAARAADQPHEIVERHRAVVRVAADEVLGGAPRVVRVLDRVDLVLGGQWSTIRR
jgi:hypothetical protein